MNNSLEKQSRNKSLHRNGNKVSTRPDDKRPVKRASADNNDSISSASSKDSDEQRPNKKARKFGIAIRPRSNEDKEDIEVLWEDCTQLTFYYDLFKAKGKGNSGKNNNLVGNPVVASVDLKCEPAEDDDYIQVLYEGPSPYASSSSSQGSSSSASSSNSQPSSQYSQ